MGALVTPIIPVGSAYWPLVAKTNTDMLEELGWPELAQETARIWGTLSDEERAHAAVFCSNYGEAGALNFYGPPLGLPPVVSPVNSFWLRGPPGVKRWSRGLLMRRFR